jgi:hypothetical protein
MPKALFLFLGFLVLSSTGLSAQQQAGQSKHSPTITAQGHPHETLTRLFAGKPHPHASVKPNVGDSIDPKLVKCLVGHVADSLPIDTAYLLVKWTDGKREEFGDSIFLWGYRWNSISVYVNPTTGKRDTTYITKHSIDMLRAIANADCRFSVLLQWAGNSGYTAGGFGYNYTAFDDCKTCHRVPLRFDLTSAQKDATIAFRYSEFPNCSIGQVAVPPQPAQQADLAIQSAASSTFGQGNGIIEHPFGANYGYPAYDYDYWVLIDSAAVANPDYEWLAGWQYGYWSSYIAENRQVPSAVDYSNYGISTRILQNNSVDGFAFSDFTRYPDMSGKITAALCLCACPSAQPTHKPRKP